MKRKKKEYFYNISIEAFFKSPDISEYERYIKFLKGKNSFLLLQADTESITFAEVARSRELVQDTSLDNFIELYEIFYKVDAKKFLSAPVLDLFYSNKFIVEYLNSLDKREKLLDIHTSEEDRMKWKAAGGDRLNQFKELGIMINLGMQFSLSPETIGDWKYNLVYAILLYSSIDRDIEKRKNELRK